MKKETNKFLHAVGFILYLIGMLTALLLLSISVWGDVEASSFDAALTAQENLDSLRCPVMIAKGETGVISMIIENPLDKDVDPKIRTRITMGFVTMVREYDERIPVSASSSKTMEWEVTEGDAAYRRLILARIYQFSNRSLPSRMGSCGIVVLPFNGLTGQQFLWVSYSASIVLMGLGLYLYIRNRENDGKRNLHMSRSYIFLGTYLLVAILLTLFGNWLLSGILFIFAVISLIGVFSYAATSK